MAGRKLLLDTALIDSIANWLKLGYYQEDAAIMAGISESTFYKWMKKANELDQLDDCLLYTSPSPRDQRGSRMPSSA